MTETLNEDNNEIEVPEPIIKRGRGRPKKDIERPVKGPKGRPLKFDKPVKYMPEYFNEYYKTHYAYRTTCPNCFNKNVLKTNLLRHTRTDKCNADRIKGVHCSELNEKSEVIQNCDAITSEINSLD